LEALFVTLQKILPKRFLSDCVGALTRIQAGALTHTVIRAFMRFYPVELREAEHTVVTDYPSFNAFFTRALGPGARPQPEGADEIACSADGVVSALGRIEQDSLLQAKGVDYATVDLFAGDSALADYFAEGSYQTIYLAPHNYHRVHMPLSGKACALRYIPGALFSVNAVTTRRLPGLFCQNERVAVVFQHQRGYFALIMVGAMNVGSIQLTLPGEGGFRNRLQASQQPLQTYPLDGPVLNRGDEFGRFNMGSTVIFLASRDLLRLDENLDHGSHVQVGMRIGKLIDGAT